MTYHYISFSKEERAKRREIRTKQHEEKLIAFKRIENLLERLIEKKISQEIRSHIRLKIFLKFSLNFL